jgi:hypothetical protein
MSISRGAVAGVDAAVPHLAFAGQLGGGQQLAVVHAAQREVPLAHAFVAQAQRDELQRAHSPGLRRGLALGGWSTAAGAAGSAVRPPSSSAPACRRS